MNGSVLPHYYWENDEISATEFQLNREYLEKTSKRTKRFANRGGRSSDSVAPFFDVTADGAGYFVAIGWTVWQYHDAEAGKGILVAFRREKSPFASVDVSLKGIEAHSNVQFWNMDTDEKWNGTREMTVSLPSKRSSVIIEYTVL